VSGIQWTAIAISVCAIGLSGYSVWTMRRVARSMQARAERAQRIEVPGGIVTFPRPMTDGQVAEFKRRWVEAHGRRRAVSHTDPVEPPGGGAEKV
jgi:hypothetical protein